MRIKINMPLLAAALLVPAAALAQDASPAATPAPLAIGGYGEVAFQGSHDAKSVDARRMVLFVGYRFADTMRFVSELESEHASTLEVEQLYLESTAWKSGPKLRAGLMLVPLGIVNEHHEPPVFLGVDRPAVDTLLIPSTWREVGGGIAGSLGESLDYELYVMNGLDGDRIDPDSGIGPARGQGMGAHANQPAGAGRIAWSPWLGTQIGLGGYFGGAGADVRALKNAAVGIGELDAKLDRAGVTLRGELVDVEILHARDINNVEEADWPGPSVSPPPSPVGSAMRGGYAQAGYDVLHPLHAPHTLVAFARFEALDMRAKSAAVDPTFNLFNGPLPNGREPWRLLYAGLQFSPAPQVALKVDYRWALKQPAPPPAVASTGGDSDEGAAAFPRGNVFSLGVGFAF